MIAWISRMWKGLWCEHEWDKGVLINLGMQKRFTCTKCKRRSTQ